MKFQQRCHGGCGFTLIELLVAIALLALMAALSWRGIDGMLRTQSQLHARATPSLALAAGLGQWGADLDALARQEGSATLDWDGRSLRIVRRDSVDAGAGLRVVAWTRRMTEDGGQWLRWQSAPLTGRAELAAAWQAAALWAQNPGEQARTREVRIAALEQWQIFYYRADAWSNPLSSAGGSATVMPPGAEQIPDGIRLVLTLPSGQAISGVLTRDWIRPSVGGGK